MCNKLICLWVLAGLVLWSPLARAVPPVSPSTQPTPVAIVALHGEVNDYTKGTLIRQFTQARSAGAKTIVLDIDTYGGRVGSALEITQFIRLQEKDVHIVAYVDRAYSAGSMIAVACDEIVMAPSATIGDCAPIQLTEDSEHKLVPLPAAERAKMQSPIVTDFDASADHAGYSRLLLEAMVIAERVVYWVEDPKTNERRFVDQAEYDKLTAKGWISVPGVPCPIDGPDTLLTLQTDEAVKLGLAKGVSPSAAALAAERGKLIGDFTPPASDEAGEKMLEFFNNDIVRGMLFTILTISLWVVLGSPGHGLAEACAIISLGLLLGVPLLTGYASWWEVIAIFGGLALLAFEVFVFPGHGFSAILGIILILGGLLFTFVGPIPGGGIFPNSNETWTNLRHGALALVGGLAGSMALSAWLRNYLPKLPYFKKLILTATSGGEPMQNSSDIPPENNWPGVGTAGIAVTDLRPGGSAEFLDLSVGTHRPIAVISETGYVTAGSKLVVRESKGNRIVVRPVSA